MIQNDGCAKYDMYSVWAIDFCGDFCCLPLQLFAELLPNFHGDWSWNYLLKSGITSFPITDYDVQKPNLQTVRLDSDQLQFCGCWLSFLGATGYVRIGTRVWTFLCSFSDVNNCRNLLFLFLYDYRNFSLKSPTLTLCIIIYLFFV